MGPGLPFNHGDHAHRDVRYGLADGGKHVPSRGVVPPGLWGWDNVRLVAAPADRAPIDGTADAALFCAVHHVMQSRAALEHVFDHLRPGAPVAAAGGKWPSAWLWSLRACLADLHVPLVTDFSDFDRPWRLLGRARARPAGPRAGVRCRIPSAGPRPGPLEAPGRRDAAATTRSTRPLPGVAPGVLGQPARDAGLRRRATRLPGDRRRAGEATALLRAASGCQPRAEPTMEPPLYAWTAPKTTTQARTDKREVAATP
jgi:hypothetical protein